MNSVSLKILSEVSLSASSLLEPIHSPDSGVQIWIAHLDSISSIDMVELIASLDSAEQSRGAQFRFERDRHRYFAARGVLRFLLGAALDIPASTLVFRYGPHGKPTIDNDERTLGFNLSHAAGSAIFALAWDRNVGIDLEASAHLAHNSQELSDLAVRILSPRELAIWCALPDDAARGRAFLRAWTRKEAYVKATGEGLLDRLQTIDVILDAAAPQPSTALRNWNVHDLVAPDGFVAALVIDQLKPQPLESRAHAERF